MAGKIQHEEAYQRVIELSRLKISKRKASRILAKEGFFANSESARSFIREHTFANGKNSRPNIQWSTDVPTSEESEFAIKEINSNVGILLMTDIHIPFHDEKTIRKALGMKNEYDTVILQEVFDFYSLSKFSKDKTVSIKQEQDSFFQLMEWIREIIPNHKIYFQQGNHDERFWVYIMRKARELEELSGLEFETIFGFNDFDIELIPKRNLLNYRGLYIGHGHEINAGGAPVSPARTFFLKTGGNFIGGHFHRTSEYIDRNIKDEVIGCWSVGCCCDLHPMYAPINKWNNGFGIIKPLNDNHFHVKNIKIF